MFDKITNLSSIDCIGLNLVFEIKSDRFQAALTLHFINTYKSYMYNYSSWTTKYPAFE